MHRERILSWIEHLGILLSDAKKGSYFVQQRDEHLSDLGDPAVPDLGLGVLSNALITGIIGQTDISPFLNDGDGLSILDRRFWVLDTRLDSLTPPTSATPYSDFQVNGEGRPVLPDRITGILDSEDQFRPLRFAWIDYRVNRLTGTRVRIENFDRELPRRQRERERLLKLLRNT
jgi:hypothetical protein